MELRAFCWVTNGDIYIGALDMSVHKGRGICTFIIHWRPHKVSQKLDWSPNNPIKTNKQKHIF